MSCDNNVTKGRELVVLVRTDDETTFEVIGGIRDRGITFANPVEEVTSSSTTGEYTEAEFTGYSQATINLSGVADKRKGTCLLYTSPSPRDGLLSRMPSSA